MPITPEQIEEIRAKQRACVQRKLPAALRKVRSKSRFEKMAGGKLRKKSSSSRRWTARSLYMTSITAVF